ncbi:MAG: hypothetical protein WB757_03465 [Candidatus Cybelea sp.]|jgi:proteasome lid subunit RPN8/RPN11
MNFSIAATMRRLWSPQHKISCSWLLWLKLLSALRERGRGCSRESGAFLLGHRSADATRIADFALYDDIDPHALDTGIVRLDGRHFGVLWDICKKRQLAVVADVHVHPGSAEQSDSDRAHPIISNAGHIAFVLPRFAKSALRSSDIGIYQYLGAKKWHTVPPPQRRAFFHIGL